MEKTNKQANRITLNWKTTFSNPPTFIDVFQLTVLKYRLCTSNFFFIKASCDINSENCVQMRLFLLSKGNQTHLASLTCAQQTLWKAILSNFVNKCGMLDIFIVFITA